MQLQTCNSIRTIEPTLMVTLFFCAQCYAISMGIILCIRVSVDKECMYLSLVSLRDQFKVIKMIVYIRL